MLVDELVSYVGEPRATTVAVAVGAAAGLALALMAERSDSLSPSPASRSAWCAVRPRGRSHAAAVGAVFPDGKHLVLLGHRGEELAREDSDLGEDRLRMAFLTHGYSWLAGVIHTRTSTGSGSRTRRNSIRRRRVAQGAGDGRLARGAKAKRTRRSCARSSQGSASWSAKKETPVLAPRRRVRTRYLTLTSQDDAR